MTDTLSWNTGNLRRLAYLCLILVFFYNPSFLGAGTSLATQTSIYICVGDTHADSRYPDSNFGGDSALFSSYLPGMTVYANIFLAFQITDLPADFVVSSVQIEVSVTLALIDVSHTIVVSEVSAFQEDGLTWNNQPSASAGNLVSVSTHRESGRMKFTLSESGYDNHDPHHVRGNGGFFFLITVIEYGLVIKSRESSSPPLIHLNDSGFDLGSLIDDYGFILAILGVGTLLGGYYFFQRRNSTPYIPTHSVEDHNSKYYCTNCGEAYLIDAVHCIKCGSKRDS
ncbi:MAG: DNRLRE domain-containing protein [Candidatus Hodarchaeales archaeon]